MRKRINGSRVRVLSCSGKQVRRIKSGMNIVSRALYALVDLGVQRFVGTLEECQMLQQELQERNIKVSIAKA